MPATDYLRYDILDLEQITVLSIISQMHNFQKLKTISLKAVNFLATKTKFPV